MVDANERAAGDAGHFSAGYGLPGQAFPSFSQNHESRQDIIDNEQLRLLRIGYFISAGQTAIFVPIGLLYASMGLLFSHLPTSHGSAPPPAAMSWIFAVFGSVFAGLGGLAALLKLLTAIRLKERRSRVLCLVTAGLSCIEIPYGTALGIMTFIVLGRPNVREQFDRPSAHGP